MNKLSLVIEEKKWNEYRKKYDEAANLKLLNYPIQIDFELNSSCNLKCPMCPISAESPKGKGKSTWFDFELYKKIPQFQLLNNTMDLAEFKIIFYWEYAHRILARLIGIFFIIPLVYFYLSKKKGNTILLMVKPSKIF